MAFLRKYCLQALMFTLIISVLSACQFNVSKTSTDGTKTKSNTISKTDLSEREKAILTTTTDQSFVFDYRNTTYKEAHVWIDKYASGELKEKRIGDMTAEIGKEGSIVLTTPSLYKEHKQLTFNIGISEKNGMSSAAVPTKAPKEKESTSITYGDLPQPVSLTSDKTALATIAYSNGENGLTSIPDSFFKKPDAHMSELDKYDVVYVFNIKFKK